jgi:hypothetical protein
LGGIDLLGGEAGHAVGDLDRAAAAVQVAHGPVDDEQLGCVREGDRLECGAHPDRSVLDAPMPMVSIRVRRGKTCPGEPVDGGLQAGLVGLHSEQVVGVLVLD